MYLQKRKKINKTWDRKKMQKIFSMNFVLKFKTLKQLTYTSRFVMQVVGWTFLSNMAKMVKKTNFALFN